MGKGLKVLVSVGVTALVGFGGYFLYKKLTKDEPNYKAPKKVASVSSRTSATRDIAKGAGAGQLLA